MNKTESELLAEIAKKEKALKEQKERLQFIFGSTEIGEWSLSLADHTVLRSLRHDNIFGYRELQPKWTYGIFLDHVVPEDRSHVEETFGTALKNRTNWDFECRIIRVDEETRWIWACGKHQFNEQGAPIYLVGIVKDITQRKNIENELLYMKSNLELLVKQRTSELEKAQMLLKASLESPKDMIILSIDKNYNYHFFNRAHHDAMEYAYGKDVNIGTNLLEAITSDEDRINARMNYDMAMSGKSHTTIQKYGDLAVNYYETFYNPVLNDKNEIVGATAFARNVSDRIMQEEKIKELNNRLESHVLEKTAQLESVNKELETFSYSVSHDLKAPLRHITGFVSILEKKQAESLSEEGRRYLGNVSIAARNMGELIDGLLQFSRNGRIHMNQRLLNMNELIHHVIQPIQEQDANHRIEWSIGAMPNAYGDYEMIKSVWNNLIDNAVKFSKNKTYAKIGIGAEENDMEIIYHIEDNGAGFDMNYASKLFEVFQRLHDREDFEGSGIGLATLRRIIIKHGGKTWAEGKVGEGATFYFTLPKRKESESEWK